MENLHVYQPAACGSIGARNQDLLLIHNIHEDP